LRDLFVEEIKYRIVRADHCRFQTALNEIRELEGCYDSVRTIAF
jgi:hypothetical protein